MDIIAIIALVLLFFKVFRFMVCSIWKMDLNRKHPLSVYKRTTTFWSNAFQILVLGACMCSQALLWYVSCWCKKLSTNLNLVVCSRTLMVSNTPSSVYTPVLNYDGERFTDGTGYNLKLLHESQAENHILGRSNLSSNF